MNLNPTTVPTSLELPDWDQCRPFTPSIAFRAGLGRAALERAVRDGSVVRLLRGVYLGAEATLDVITRAQALALVVSRRHVVVGTTAAWVHGGPRRAAQVRDAAPVAVEVLGRRRYPCPPVPLRAEEIEVLGGLRCTSALRTAMDLARQLPASRSLPWVDALLESGSLTHGDLLAGARSGSHLPGSASVREIAAIADGRARGPAESVLRLHWSAARLPTPTPGWRLGPLRAALALPVQRFAVVLAGRFARSSLESVEGSGWTVLVLEERKILTSDPQALGRHLEREFHRHLLGHPG